VLKGAAHITGGGITGNTPRILPDKLAAEIHTGSWKVLPVFDLLRCIGNMPDDDWRRTFNLGVGMILAVSPAGLSKAESVLRKLRQRSSCIGVVVTQPRSGERVVYA
jgi:phosphoribosylformylglycinamidine cyclo-ligase